MSVKNDVKGDQFEMEDMGPPSRELRIDILAISQGINYSQC